MLEVRKTLEDFYAGSIDESGTPIARQQGTDAATTSSQGRQREVVDLDEVEQQGCSVTLNSGPFKRRHATASDDGTGDAREARRKRTEIIDLTL